MALKHNKKKNTGIIYEQLIALMSRLVANKKQKEADIIYEIVLNNFKIGSEILKEKKIFDSLKESQALTKENALKILEQALKQSKNINTQKLEKEKISLINEISLKLDKSFFKIPLKNYKSLASIQIILNEERDGFKFTDPKERVKISNNIINSLCKKTKEEPKQNIDNFTYKILLNKFNKKYQDIINEDQKEILKEWIMYLLSGNQEKFKNLLNIKYEDLNKKVNFEILNEVHKNKPYYELLVETSKTLKNIINSNILEEENIYKFMKFYELIEDLEESKEEYKDG